MNRGALPVPSTAMEGRFHPNKPDQPMSSRLAESFPENTQALEMCHPISVIGRLSQCRHSATDPASANRRHSTASFAMSCDEWCANGVPGKWM